MPLPAVLGTSTPRRLNATAEARAGWISQLYFEMDDAERTAFGTVLVRAVQPRHACVRACVRAWVCEGACACVVC